LTDSNGTLVSTYQYDPYGNLTSSTGSVTNPWRFAGGYFDSSTGLYKFGARYYDPTIGRWTQQDLLRGSLSDPTSLNRYVYAGDDPVNLVDPSGTFTLDLACIVTIIAALGAILAILSAAAVDIQGIGGLAFLIGIFDPALGLIVLIIGYLIALVFYLSALAVIYQGIAGACGLPRIP